MRRLKFAVVASSLTFVSTVPLAAQGRPDPATLIAAQTEAITALKSMDGVWRGNGWTVLGNGQKHGVTQTERIGPFLGGSVKVIEGRGYDATTGDVTFNASGSYRRGSGTCEVL